MDTTTLSLTRFDSGTPQGMAAVLHPLEEPGTYRVVARSSATARTVRVVEVREGAVPPDADPSVDLSSAGLLQSPLELPVGSALVVHAAVTPAGRGREPQRAELVDEAGRVRWASVALNEGDLFVVLPLRPGGYELTDRERSAALQVRYPDPRPSDMPPGGAWHLPLRPADPFAEELVLDCGQGLVLPATRGARFVLELREPDDGPADLAAWKAEHDRELLARFGRTD